MVDKLDYNKLIGYEFETTQYSITENDAIIYALGIAFSMDPLKSEDWNFTNEQSEQFRIFPTQGAVISKPTFYIDIILTKLVPQFNPMMLLHAEQRLEIYKPLKLQTQYLTKRKITDVQDKKKGALFVETDDSYEIDEQGKEILAFRNVITLYIRGMGGFGFQGLKNQEEIPQNPNRLPDKVYEQGTFPAQAFLYRLSGDPNPLHVNSDMAALGGFKQPILHGLATYGMCAKVIIQTFCKGDGDKLKAYQARFTSHVFPGETLLVQMWKDGSRIIFSAKTKERELEVIRGFMDIIEDPKL